MIIIVVVVVLLMFKKRTRFQHGENIQGEIMQCKHHGAILNRK